MLFFILGGGLTPLQEKQRRLDEGPTEGIMSSTIDLMFATCFLDIGK